METKWNISCVFCEKHFLTKAKFNLHILTHTNERYYWCDQCPTSLMTRAGLKSHKRIHSGGMPYSCGICKRKFNLKSNFDSHMLTHTGEFSYKCRVCGKGHQFRSSKTKCETFHDLEATLEKEESLRKTLGDGPFKCEICLKGFHNKNAVQIHDRVVHSKQRGFDCKKCGKKFTRRTYLKTHLVTHKKRKRFCCALCPVKYFQKGSLTNHMKYFHDKNYNFKFECIFCKKKHQNKGSLQKHLIAHIKECPNFCDSCPAEFSDPASMRGHKLRIHNGVKRIKCGICEKLFFTNADVTRHFIWHTGEKSHKCSICKWEFRDKSGLNQHVRCVHGVGKEVQCKFCGKLLKNRNSIRGHLRKWCRKNANQTKKDLAKKSIGMTKIKQDRSNT